MFTSHKQISPPSLVLKLKISEVSQKWIPKAVELKRIPTHKKCKCKKFCSQTRLVGEIYSSDVIMHRGYWTSTWLDWKKKKCYDRTIDSPSLYPQGKFPFIISDKVHWVDVKACSSHAHCLFSLYLYTREVSFAFSAVILLRRRVRCLDESAFDMKNYQQRNKSLKKNDKQVA